jgi:hypothetical protein
MLYVDREWRARRPPDSGGPVHQEEPMNQLGALRGYLEQHFPRTTGLQPQCTCGAGNHVRVCFFRVDGQPASVVIPEGASLTAAELQEVLGCDRVEPLTESDWEQMCADTELGHLISFENPFGAGVIFDDLLREFPNLVFCPRMFSGERGVCFHVPTEEFLNLTNALVVPLTAQVCRPRDDWAV